MNVFIAPTQITVVSLYSIFKYLKIKEKKSN